MLSPPMTMEDLVNYALVAVLVLAGCGQQPEKTPGNEARTVTSAAQPTPPKPRPQPFAFDEENDLIEFHYGWSPEAAEVPVLVKRFQDELQVLKAKLLQGAKEDKALRDEEGFDFHGHM